MLILHTYLIIDPGSDPGPHVSVSLLDTITTCSLEKSEADVGIPTCEAKIELFSNVGLLILFLLQYMVTHSHACQAQFLCI